MSRLAAVLAFILLTGCATDRYNNIPRDYSGADTGWLVVSIRTTDDNRLTDTYLQIRSRDGARIARIFYSASGVSATPRDYDGGGENGAVLVRSLPAGDYEIHNFQAAGYVGGLQTTISSRIDFNIPFSIQPGRASYVGSFKAHPTGTAHDPTSLGQFLFGGAIDAGVVFVVTDESERDIPIARSRSVEIVTIQSVVPNVDEIGNPLLRRSPP
jgi:hypothetical protein